MLEGHVQRGMQLLVRAERARERSTELRQLLATTLTRVSQATVILPHSELVALRAEVEGLRAAMASRAVIEQAKGVVMATVGCDADAAFALLVQQSQHENRKLREIAAELVAAQPRRSSR